MVMMSARVRVMGCDGAIIPPSGCCWNIQKKELPIVRISSKACQKACHKLTAVAFGLLISYIAFPNRKKSVISPISPFTDYENAAFTDVYDELPLWSASFGLHLLEPVVLCDNVSVLDVGSGCGFPALELAQRMGRNCTVIGIDPAEMQPGSVCECHPRCVSPELVGDCSGRTATFVFRAAGARSQCRSIR